MFAAKLSEILTGVCLNMDLILNQRNYKIRISDNASRFSEGKVGVGLHCRDFPHAFF